MKPSEALARRRPAPEPKDDGEPIAWRPPAVELPEPNGWALIVQAAALSQGSEALGLPARVESIVRLGRADAPALADRAAHRALVEANRPALEHLRAGLRLPVVEPPDWRPERAHPTAAPLRRLCRMLVVEAHLRALDRRWAQAFDSLLDAVAAGLAVARGGVAVSALSAVGMQIIGMRPAWDCLNNLNVDEAAAAARRLEALLAGRVAFAEVMATETAFCAAMATWLLNDFRAQRLAQVGERGWYALETRCAVRRLGRRRLHRRWIHYFDSLAEAAAGGWGTPWPRYPYGWAQPRRHAATWTMLRWKWTLQEASANLLLVTLALHAARLAGQEAVTTVADLVPQWLTAPPADPFAPGQPLRLRRMHGWHRAYSVGPDGRDDGGRRLRGPAWFLSHRRRGDLLAGVNR